MIGGIENCNERMKSAERRQRKHVCCLFIVCSLLFVTLYGAMFTANEVFENARANL